MKVAIDGFGPAGRAVFRALQERPGLELVAIRDEADPESLALLARRDSVRGLLPGRCELDDGRLVTAAGAARLLPAREARCPDWRALGVEVVVQAAAAGPCRTTAAAHLAAGARQVVVVGPARREATVVRIRGVDGGGPLPPSAVLSAGSGPANALAVLVRVLEGAFGLEQGLATVTGPAGADQCLVDSAHGDPRRGRAAGLSLVPTSSGAAREAMLALPQLAGRLASISLRAPVVAGSAIDLAAVLGVPADARAVNDALRAAAAGMPDVLGIAEDPLVSVDIAGSTWSCLFDPGCTRLAGDRAVGVLAWCDAGTVEAARACDLIADLAPKT
jgi:glyceraldehyde 3-phosphate dehydrogenase